MGLGWDRSWRHHLLLLLGDSLVVDPSIRVIPLVLMGLLLLLMWHMRWADELLLSLVASISHIVVVVLLLMG